MSPVRIATRGSPLALAQAGQVAASIAAALGSATELVVVRTTGDRIQDRALAAIGGKGLFVKEIEEALLAGEADVAVHSAKDLPARLAQGLVLAAFPERADARDAIVARAPLAGLDALPQKARIGTGSVRRGSQLLARRPDLALVSLRGNVGTRLRRLAEDGLDAVVLACAGLDRLALADRIALRIPPDELLPAVGQGTLALETRAGDPLAERLGALDHAPTRAALLAERAFGAGLDGDCSVPLAAFAELRGGRLRLRGLVASADGRRLASAEGDDAPERAQALGERLAAEVRRAGGDEILAELRAGGGA